MKQAIQFILTLSLSLSTAANAVDLNEVQQRLATTGVESWVHGDVADRHLFVVSIRNPQNFFDYVIVALVPSTPEIATQLQTFGRHDKIRIKGEFIMPNNPQKHISVKSVELVEKFQSGFETKSYGYEAKIPDELNGKDSALFLVHAIGGGGRVLVVEYKDQVLPIPVRNPELTKNLFRNDLVRLKFKIRDEPEQPAHLKLDETKPIEVVESIQAKHGQQVTIEGPLVLFPKSPDLKFNVFAVLEELPEGLKRQYTLVNFSSMEAFTQIREKLQAAWDKKPQDYVNGRNKLVHTKVRVRVTGLFNEVDPNQANAQVLLESADSIEVLGD